MRKAFLIAALSGALAGCASSGASSNIDGGAIRGPARLCFNETAFMLPSNGLIVDARSGRYDATLNGSIGLISFRMTESRDFVPPENYGPVVYEKDDMIVRQVGTGRTSFAVLAKTRDNGVAREELLLRLDHSFGFDSISMEDFFSGLDVRGARTNPETCTRRFTYG